MKKRWLCGTMALVIGAMAMAGVQAEILLHPHLQPEPKQQIVIPA